MSPHQYAVNVAEGATDTQDVSTVRLVASSILLLFAALPAPACDDGERGIAGWYGARFAGNATASGEPFDPDALTAAHRTLPLGSVVEVTDTASGESVQVTINDRGPYTQGRIIDLSRAAADRLGMVENATVEVDLCTLSVPDSGAAAVDRRNLAGVSPAASSAHSGDTVVLQIASFSNPENLERAVKLLAAEDIEVEIVEQDDLYRLLVVDIAPEDTPALIEQLEALGFPGAFRLGGMPRAGR